MKKSPILFAVLFLILSALACNFLGGCNGTEEAAVTVPEEPSPDSTSGEDSEPPADATEVPDSEATDSEEDEGDSASTDEEETEEPAVEPTLAPTLTPTVAPTLAPTAVLTDTTDANQEQGDQGQITGSGGSVSTGGGWGESGTGAQTACDHPYLPLRTGSTWTYTGSQGEAVWEVTDVQGDLNNATANLRITVAGASIDYTWNCTAGEGIASFDLATLGLEQLGTEFAMEQTSAEGQFLLPADELEPGASWEMRLESTLQFSQEVGGEAIEVSGDMSTVQTSTVSGNDPVTFDGATVDGIQIEQSDVINMNISVLGTQVEQSVNVTNLYELGRGIGIVQQSSTTDFGSDTSSLVSYYIP